MHRTAADGPSIGTGSERHKVIDHTGVIQMDVIDNLSLLLCLSDKSGGNVHAFDLSIFKDGGLVSRHDFAEHRLAHTKGAVAYAIAGWQSSADRRTDFKMCVSLGRRLLLFDWVDPYPAPGERHLECRHVRRLGNARAVAPLAAAQRACAH